MDTPLAELLSIAAQAALKEAAERKEIIKAKIAAICGVFGVEPNEQGFNALTGPAYTAVSQLIEEYKAWNEAGHKAHMICADARRDTTR